MKAFWLRWFANAGILMLVANQINGPHGPNAADDVFKLKGFGAAMGAVVLITLCNVLLQPLAKLVKSLGCVLNFLSMGLLGLAASFLFYVFAFYVVGVLELVGGFQVAGFREAAAGALCLAVANALLSPIIERDGQREEERLDDQERRR